MYVPLDNVFPAIIARAADLGCTCPHPNTYSPSPVKFRRNDLSQLAFVIVIRMTIMKEVRWVNIDFFFGHI
jgi:hypothetical protein